MPLDHAAIERNFLGCLLLSPHSYWQVADSVSPEMLMSRTFSAIYSAIRTVCEGGRQASITTLCAALPADMGEDGPTRAILWALRESAKDAGNAEDYAEVIAQSAAQKRIAALGDWIKAETGKLGASDRSVEDIAADAAMKLQEIMAVAAPIRPKQIGEVADEVLKNSNAVRMGEAEPGISTGIGPIDEILGPIFPGNMIGLLGAQGDGKSVLGAQIASNVAEQGIPVLFFQFEMGDEEVAAREIAARSRVSVSDIEMGNFELPDWQNMVRASDSMKRIPLYIVDADALNTKQMASIAERLEKRIGRKLGLIVIDQLDKVETDRRHKDPFSEGKYLTKSLKAMFKRLRAAGLVLAQRTRMAQRHKDETPRINDCDYPSFEKDCDVLIAAWRKSNWLQQNRPDGRDETEFTKWQSEMVRYKDRADVICLKNRRGKAFEQRALTFRGAVMRFEEPE